MMQECRHQKHAALSEVPNRHTLRFHVGVRGDTRSAAQLYIHGALVRLGFLLISSPKKNAKLTSCHENRPENPTASLLPLKDYHGNPVPNSPSNQ